MTENQIDQVFKWNITTDMGVFSGTCLSLVEVYKKIVMLTNKTNN